MMFYKWKLYFKLYWNMLLKKLGLRKDNDDQNNFIY